MQRLKTKITLCYFYTFYHGGKGIVNMSEISNNIHCNELRTLSEEELLKVLESVETKKLIHALWNKVEKLENLEADMQKLLNK